MKAVKVQKAANVAEYIASQIALSGKKQNVIYKEAGFKSPNVVSMIKQGNLKLPLTKVVPMAKSIGVDPLYLLRMAMSEYHPEIWEVLEETMGDSVLLTANEKNFIRILRSAKVDDPKIDTHEQEIELLDFANRLKSGQE